MGESFCNCTALPPFFRSVLDPDILPSYLRTHSLRYLAPSLPTPPPCSDAITASGTCTAQIPGQVAVRRGYRGCKPRYQTACIFRTTGAIVSFYELRMLLTSCGLVWAIKTVQVYWLLTEEFLIDWYFSSLEFVTNMAKNK